MKVKAARWGTDLGCRIPRDLASRIGLRARARVEIEAQGGLIWTGLDPRGGTLAALLGLSV